MASSTYLQITNRLLRELNEVELTDVNFANATNIQGYVKDLVNKVYLEVCEWEDGRMPWLAETNSQNQFLGNTYVETVEGTRWYLLNPDATDYDDDYAVVDWEHFLLTTEGVAGEDTPYTYRKLVNYSIEEWWDWRSNNERIDKAGTQAYSIPKGVIRNPDGRRFGLTGIPDSVYRVYFWAWKQPSRLTAYDDAFPCKEEWIPVIEAGIRYYAWQFKENAQQAGLAQRDYDQGVKRLLRNMRSKQPDRAKDDRTRIV